MPAPANICRIAALILGVTLADCRRPPREPVSLQYTYSWNEDRPKERALFQRYAEQTGVRVKNIPVPEYTREYLDLARKLLSDGSGADLLNIDVIWSSILAPDLIDLRPFLAEEIPQIEPQLLASYTVDGKLIAVPFNVPLGSLEYRSDLLHEYGYDHPPKTWDELETMAEHIQAGERAKGNKDFWGYVWQGAAGEALTCNALEWQAAAGGGRIIEPDRTVSVNNPLAIQSWERARRWVGRISPPGVLAYRELDSMLVFNSGRAAFNRLWLLTPMTTSGEARRIAWRSTPPAVKTGFSRLPAGPYGSMGTMGGTGTAISAHSTHRQEAVDFLRYQLRALMSDPEHPSTAGGPAKVEFADPPSVSGSGSNLRASIVARPSVVAGSNYKLVSKAYFDAVHSVLTGQKPAAAAVSELEKQLVEITHFPVGAPKTSDH